LSAAKSGSPDLRKAKAVPDFATLNPGYGDQKSGLAAVGMW
jgi:hypothetical protein